MCTQDQLLEACSFLTQSELAFHTNLNIFPSDNAIIVYGTSYTSLKDVILWYQTHLSGLTTSFTWETFKTSFLKACSETDKKQTERQAQMYATKGHMLYVHH
jgi:hypothetical protein